MAAKNHPEKQKNNTSEIFMDVSWPDIVHFVF